MFDGEWNNLNAGVNLNLGPVNLYAAMDHIPLKYAKCEDVKFPSDTRFMRANVGLAFVFGYKKPVKDSDGDGVPDNIDLCPETLPGISVDTVGCPLDTDKDGIPDYLDRCPDTPEGVNVDPLGCPVDSDGDGVVDYLDKCPDTPSEAQVDSMGCPIDSDGDGIADYLDKCSDTPEEAYGKIDAQGCPLDSDNDGVADYLDKCPDVAGIESNNGCPEVAEEIKQVFKKALTGIQFETGKSVIKKSSYPVLNDIVKIMKENSTYKLNIAGHTDNVGNPDKNKKLSEDRANSVKTYLKKKGVAEARMEAIGYGDQKPLQDNSTAKGRAKNRRVEFEVEY